MSHACPYRYGGGHSSLCWLFRKVPFLLCTLTPRGTIMIGATSTLAFVGALAPITR